MNDKHRGFYVDTAGLAAHLGITETLVRQLTHREVFTVWAVRQTGLPGRPPALYNLYDAEQAFAEYTQRPLVRVGHAE